VPVEVSQFFFGDEPSQLGALFVEHLFDHLPVGSIEILDLLGSLLVRLCRIAGSKAVLGVVRRHLVAVGRGRGLGRLPLLLKLLLVPSRHVSLLNVLSRRSNAGAVILGRSLGEVRVGRLPSELGILRRRSLLLFRNTHGHLTNGFLNGDRLLSSGVLASSEDLVETLDLRRRGARLVLV